MRHSQQMQQFDMLFKNKFHHMTDDETIHVDGPSQSGPSSSRYPEPKLFGEIMVQSLDHCGSHCAGSDWYCGWSQCGTFFQR